MKPDFDTFRDRCVAWFVVGTLHHEDVKYSDTVSAVIADFACILKVKPLDLSTIDTSKVTPGSLLISRNSGHAEMILSADSCTYTVLKEDGQARTRTWMLNGKPERWTKIVPLESIYHEMKERK